MNRHTHGLPQASTILHVQRENWRTQTYILDAHWQAYPGQFLMAWIPGFDEKPFSLVNHDPVTITVAAIGPFTRQLHNLHAGDKMWIRGPFGSFFRQDHQHILAVGGGYGVGPIHFLARQVVADGGAITVIAGAQSARDLLFVDSLRELGIDVYITTEDGSRGRKGLTTSLATELLTANHAFDVVAACGPSGMLLALRDVASQHNLPTQLAWEAYMRCGIGLCGSCEVNGGLTCVDGPVL